MNVKPRRITLRINLRQLLRQRAQRRFRRSNFKSKPKMSVENEGASLRSRLGPIHVCRHPDVPAPKRETPGHDANHRGGLVIQKEASAYDIRIRPESAEPRLITENKDKRRP